MTLALAEGLVDEVKAYLEANLATKLSALDVEYADSIILENSVETFIGIKSLHSIANYPVLYVLAPTTRIEPMAASGGTVITTKPAIIVGMLAVDPDSETLQIRLYRYARALVELMMEALGTGDLLSGWNLATDEEWEIDTETGQAGTESAASLFVGEISLAMRANKIETK
jgi:hypothetical protein